MREWLKTNNTVKYAVLSSPFKQYLSEDRSLLLRSGDLVDVNFDLVVKEFRKTLDELKAMGITPIVFSPPPTNDNNLGRCLTRAEWVGLSLDECNFEVAQISQEIVNVYNFLENIKQNYRVVRIDKLTCKNSICETHIGSTFIYRDKGHLSYEGSAVLGKMSGFYKMIVSDNLNYEPNSSVD